MRDILKTEEHVPVPPSTMEDPFYRMTFIIKEEIRKQKWIEAERGRNLSWEQACAFWGARNAGRMERFARDTLRTLQSRAPAERRPKLAAGVH